MDDPLINEVMRRFDEAGALPAPADDFVIAALLGELDQVLGGGTVSRPTRTDVAETAPVRAYVESIQATSFRGIGPEAKLDLTPGPGLTVVVGRNGSGKSSLAEAAELALTGSTVRFADKTAEWTSGWRNLHCDADPAIEIALRVDGEPAARKVRVRWSGPELHQRTIDVLMPGGGKETLASLGWADAMATYRPFLSYAELSALIDGRPVDRYNALAPMMGMESLAEPLAVLSQARLAADKDRGAAKSHASRLRDSLGRSDDARAGEALARLDDADLDGLELVAMGADSSTEELRAALEHLSRLPVPDPGKAGEAAAELRAAADHRHSFAGSDVERADLLADVLRGAIAVHDHAGDQPCPVCGREDGLDDARVMVVRSELDRLDAEASTLREADRRLGEARRTAQACIGTAPAGLEDAPVDVAELVSAWQRWTIAPTDDEALATHLDELAQEVAKATTAVAEHATNRLRQMHDEWEPLARAINEYLPVGRVGHDANERFGPLKKAEKWLKDCERAIRDERFELVKGRVKDTFGTIATGSNVALEDVVLGAKKVSMSVAVDGDESVALGVMSQGELHALALSLFIPRATSDDSPFSFLLIDDPVQAMDPIRVDGLARVLDGLAASRQVVVFTHDDRLPAAIWRLQIAAKVIEVTRRPKSHVELRVSLDPVEAALDDARAVVRTESLPADVVRRVVPGLCRQALEAACLESGRRKLLAGTTHAECEQILNDNPKLMPRLAIALFGDPTRGGDVYGSVNAKFGRREADTVRECNEKAHTGADASDDLDDLVTRTAALARKVAKL